MEVVYLSPELVKPYENNPRINDNAVEAVAESIRKFGFRQPVIIDEDNVIITGHTRHKAAKVLGLKEIPCIYATDLSEEQVKAYRIADNKTGELATWDTGLLTIELEELEDFPDMDLSFLDFDDILSELDGDNDDDSYDYEEDFEEEDEDEEEEDDEERDTFDKLHKVEKGHSIVYEIAFEDEGQQSKWYSFIKNLKNKYPDEDTVAARLMIVVDEWEASNAC